ncbi:hypothetical protein MWMV17_MWMV17_02591 [Acinetobacter calcoaceticus]|uniref:DUF3298 domain-containing protein n=1 Tax=Acinetobacter calcoaceticus DSM 30006 = CIP 81.8 TaxID=981331 RepID=A0ABP2UJL5_ACICA|nr:MULTISPECIES: hypothetical protein [Acinetobacter]ENW01182.1 hypothetical protein F936_00584 [Acinetobacter calcoaceticus DSM 30006 = CIP 81.8]KQQ70146.1 hypothetical protein ASF86_13220 [Acinetobacter sp. Leaf130]UGQ25790.1 hypothetical protein LRO55_15775 [Acinetobacter calcoaceticus]CAI3148550.1 hypothetical protein MWMV17_MWMV17_02591 [Acinetobacter calcoaceticus]SUU63131.1 Protein of uncharacterised function (DUF3298) [Acinetobacter calcoaceticus]
MNLSKKTIIALVVAVITLISAISIFVWKSSQSSSSSQTKLAGTQTQNIEKAEVLPFLNLQQVKADYALPFCEKKNCIDVDIQTIKTQDAWLNEWIAKSQAKVIQDQIDLKKDLSLQQAINAYVKKSDEWQDKYSKNRAYELHLHTRIASQRNQYVLLQLGLDTKQEELTIKDRYYFFVADRKLHKSLSLLDVLKKDQQTAMHQMVQVAYQDWLKKQTVEIKKEAPKTLYWGQADWFFDGEGIGLHYQANQITKEAPQLDIYLSTEQTKKILQPEVYEQMF